MKQGKEETEFIKEENDATRKYIFQKNEKTKIGFYFVLVVLIILIVGVAITGFKF